MSGFLPEGYEVPMGASSFFSLKEQGTYRVRIVSQPVLGYSYWVEEGDKNRKVRVKFNEKDKIPAEVPADKVVHFWAVKIYNHTLKTVQVWEITQKSVMKAITSLTQDKDWGDPFAYDLKITKKGVGKQTEYTVTPSPKMQLTDEETKQVAEAEVKLLNLFTGDNPFVAKGNSKTVAESALEDVTE